MSRHTAYCEYVYWIDYLDSEMIRRLEITDRSEESVLKERDKSS